MHCQKYLVLWTVLSLSPSETFEDLLTSVQAGRFSIVKMCDELSAAFLTSVFVGSDKSSSSSVQKNVTAADVISVFGHFVL